MDNITEEASYPTPYASSPLLALLLFSLSVQKHAPDTTENLRTEYDYIVVGAGSGGSTVAGRLSEEHCVNVLVLEAGKSPPRLTEIPAIARSFVGTDIDWQYLTAPQSYTGASLKNRQLTFPSGKVIGGSSIWNAMLYVRGSRKIYDDWAAQGATGWDYENILKYFMKMEMNKNPESIEIPYHGFKGPVTVEKPTYRNIITDKMDQAVKQLGCSPIDPNGKTQNGYYKYQANVRDGQRCSTAKAYLVPVENKKNIHIVKNAFVTKLAIKNGRAIGVLFDLSGKSYMVRATKEVILSAGAINSAKLLMLSGIGPKEHLQEMNIPVVADLPVGLNLQDHAGPIATYTVDAMKPFQNRITEPNNILDYTIRKKGLLTSSEGVFYMTFLPKEGCSATNKPVPDYELYFLEGVPDVVKFQTNIIPEVYEKVFRPYENKTQVWCISHFLHEMSRGFVKLQSSDPYDDPIIDPNYFSDERDLQDVVEGLKECDRVMNTPAMRSINVKPYETIFPGCEMYAENREKYFECQTKSLIITLNHQVGTAKMGNPDDPTTVVDPELRVKGIRGLRVVDASVMPLIPTGNTNIPTIMVAEKAADIIKKEIRCRKINIFK